MVATGIIAGSWIGVVAVALRRVPERRSRYLPVAVAFFSIVGFATVRFVSLHEVDRLLARRDIGGIRLGTLVEFSLLALATAATIWFPFSPAPRLSTEQASEQTQ